MNLLYLKSNQFEGTCVRTKYVNEGEKKGHAKIRCKGVERIKIVMFSSMAAFVTQTTQRFKYAICFHFKRLE